MIGAGLLASLLLRFPFLSRVPWKLVGIAVLSIAIFAGGWTVRGWKESSTQLAAVKAAVKAERDAFAERDRDHIAQLDRDQKILEDTARDRDLLAEQLTRLQAAAVGIPLTRTVTRVVNEICSCPDTRLAPAVRLCINAALSGDAAAIAACEAERVPVGVPGEQLPAADVVR